MQDIAAPYHLEVCPSLVQRKHRLPACSNPFFSVHSMVATPYFLSCHDDLQKRQVFLLPCCRNAAVFDDADLFLEKVGTGFTVVFGCPCPFPALNFHPQEAQ